MTTYTDNPFTPYYINNEGESTEMREASYDYPNGHEDGVYFLADDVLSYLNDNEPKQQEAPELESYDDDGVYLIGESHNIYGGVEAKTEGDKYYWQVSCVVNGDKWQEIPKYLYVALMTFEAESRNDK